MDKRDLKKLAERLNNLTIEKAVEMQDWQCIGHYKTDTYKVIIKTVINYYKPCNIYKTTNVLDKRKKNTHVVINDIDDIKYLQQYEVVTSNSLYRNEVLAVNVNKLVDAIEKEIKK